MDNKVKVEKNSDFYYTIAYTQKDKQVVLDVVSEYDHKKTSELKRNLSVSRRGLWIVPGIEEDPERSKQIIKRDIREKVERIERVLEADDSLIE